MRSYLTTDKQLIGAAGTYFVMSELSSRGFHASCTFGNAPHVDILVSSPDGACSIAVQVKTTEWAKRYSGTRKQGKKMIQLQWYLGRKAAKANLRGLFIVFVDFDKWSAEPKTDCYVVPSAFIFEFLNRGSIASAWCGFTFRRSRWRRIGMPGTLSPMRSNPFRRRCLRAPRRFN